MTLMCIVCVSVPPGVSTSGPPHVDNSPHGRHHPNDGAFAAKGVSMRAARLRFTAGWSARPGRPLSTPVSGRWPASARISTMPLDAAQKRFPGNCRPRSTRPWWTTAITASPRPKSTSAPSTACARTSDSASHGFFSRRWGSRWSPPVLATRRDRLSSTATACRGRPPTSRAGPGERLAQVLPARGRCGGQPGPGRVAAKPQPDASGPPRLPGSGQTGQLLEGQRQRLVQQIGADLENTLLYVTATSPTRNSPST